MCVYLIVKRLDCTIVKIRCSICMIGDETYDSYPDIN